MRLYNYEITVHKVGDDTALKRDILNKAEHNAKIGLIQAQMELRHHTFLLEDADDNNRTEAEIKGYTDAIERDHKSINNWQTQLRAINYERQTINVVEAPAHVVPEKVNETEDKE